MSTLWRAARIRSARRRLSSFRKHGDWSFVAIAIGSQGFAFALVAIGSACAVLFAIVGVMYHTRPPKVQQSLGKGGGGLRLT
jgi:hypothetical protein